MGKAAKRERQKANKAVKQELKTKAQARAQALRVTKGIALILVVPIVVVVSILINNATNADTYTAKITVAIDGEKSLPNKGVIEVELDYANAPKSVKHFIGLAKDGGYDGLQWHRVAKDFVIQTGDPNGDGTGALGSQITSELPAKGYKTGDLAWAKSGQDPAGTANSQFFIVTGKTTSSGLKTLNTKIPQQDGSKKYEYGFIGHVIKGLDAALKIESLAPEAGDGEPTKTTKVISIEVFKNGKLIKRGDKDFPSSATTTTSTIPVSSVPTSEVTPTETSTP